MKSVLTVKIAIMAVIVLFFDVSHVTAEETVVSKLNWFDRIFKTLSWEEIQLKVDTPREICSAVRHHIPYRRDNGDEWASGREAWNRGYGDCEDIAVAISELCTKKNIKTEIFILYPESDMVGHVIVVGKWQERLWFSSNGWFEYAKDGQDIKRKIAHEMRWQDKQVVAMDWNSFRGIDSTIKPAAGGNARILIPIIGQ